MKYLMLVCVDPSIEVSPGQGEKIARWLEETKNTRLFGNQLRPQGEAQVVRLRGGKPFVTDGPFAETKEQIAGFDIIECADMQEALRVAGGHPTTRHGTIEIRPFPPE